MAILGQRLVPKNKTHPTHPCVCVGLCLPHGTVAAYDYASHIRRGDRRNAKLVQPEAVADGAHKGAMRRRAQRGHEREGDEVSVFSFEVHCTVPSRGIPQGKNPIPQIPFAFLSVRDLRWLRWGVLGPPFHSASALCPRRAEAAVVGRGTCGVRSQGSPGTGGT